MGDKKLDAFINELSYVMVEEMKDKKSALRIIDKALGVLVNDGVYAYFVFCKSQKEKKIENIYIRKVIEKFNEVTELKNYFSTDRIYNNKYGNKYEEFFRNLSSDLHRLLFFRDILERILIYARYHVKALSGDE